MYKNVHLHISKTLACDRKQQTTITNERAYHLHKVSALQQSYLKQRESSE